MLKISNATTSNMLNKVKNLYLTAFPKDEQKPFELILQKQKEGSIEILTIVNNETFIGFAITTHYKNLVLLDYFAIEEDFRNQKFGTSAFNLIKNKYSDKKFFLEIENPKNIECKNKLERILRRKFYLKNSMLETPYLINLLGVEVKLLSNTKDLSYKEYLSVYSYIYGDEISSKIHLLNETISP